MLKAKTSRLYIAVIRQPAVLRNDGVVSGWGRNGFAVPLRRKGYSAGVLAPEALPVVGHAGIEWVDAGEDRAEVRPVCPVGDEVGALRILQDVSRYGGKGVLLALRVAEHVVVRLSLKRV